MPHNGSHDNKIDRRTLIKGATAVGGAVWALPIIESVAMPAAYAGSAPTTPLTGSVGAQYSPTPIVTIPFTCGTLVETGCLSSTAADPTGGCAVSQALNWDSTTGTLQIGILPGWHLAQGSAQAGSQCIPAVQVIQVGTVVSEVWAFSAGPGKSFVAELLIVPAT